MPNFTSSALTQFFVAFKSCFTFLFQTLRGLIDYIRSYPILYIPLILTILIVFVFALIYLAQEISPTIGKSRYQSYINVYSDNNFYRQNFSNLVFFYKKYKTYKKKQSKNSNNDLSKATAYFDKKSSNVPIPKSKPNYKILAEYDEDD